MPINITKQADNFRAFILIAANFDGLTVTYCYDKMQETGLAVRLVGLVPGLMRSKKGLSLQPELTLGELNQLMMLTPQTRQLLLIPGGVESAARLFSDPRMHHACQATLQANGYIAAFAPAQQIVVNSGVPIQKAPSRFLAQNKMKTDQFVQKLIDLVLQHDSLRA